MKRRTFQHLGLLLLPLVYSGGILAAIHRFLSPLPKARRQERLVAGDVAAFSPDSHPRAFVFNHRKVWVLHDGEEIRAFDAECTHLACNVNWIEDEGAFACPCHNAGFQRHGQVARPPATKPLKEYEVHLEPGKPLKVIVLDRLKGAS